MVLICTIIIKIVYLLIYTFIIFLKCCIMCGLGGEYLMRSPESLSVKGALKEAFKKIDPPHKLLCSLIDDDMLPDGWAKDYILGHLLSHYCAQRRHDEITTRDFFEFYSVRDGNINYNFSSIDQASSALLWSRPFGCGMPMQFPVTQNLVEALFPLSKPQPQPSIETLSEEAKFLRALQENINGVGAEVSEDEAIKPLEALGGIEFRCS